MINISDETKQKFSDDIGDKVVILEFYRNEQDTTPTYTFTNDDIVTESMDLVEAISNTSDLKYGQCIASKFEIEIFNNGEDFVDWKIKAFITFKPKITYDNTSGVITQEYEKIPLFVGYIEKTKLSNDRITRRLEAYDVLYRKLSTNITDLFWRDFLLNGRNIKYIRENILRYLGIEFEQVDLVNDDIPFDLEYIEENKPDIKNIQISARMALESALEICGVFGHINREGKFVFIRLKELAYKYPIADGQEDTFYPHQASDAEVLYPGLINISDMDLYKLNSYIKIDYEEYMTANITGVEFIKNNNELVEAYYYLDNISNTYISKNNCFIEYPMHISHTTSIIAEPLYNRISKISYLPLTLDIIGLPFLEVGDYVGIDLDHDGAIDNVFPILQRRLKGIQSIQDTITNKGTFIRNKIYKI